MMIFIFFFQEINIKILLNFKFIENKRVLPSDHIDVHLSKKSFLWKLN